LSVSSSLSSKFISDKKSIAKNKNKIKLYTYTRKKEAKNLAFCILLASGDLKVVHFTL